MLEISRLPRHVAVIMDGNGRWAARQGKPRSFGHRTGSEAVRRTVRSARRLGIPALTLYAFSAQNWNRPQAEIHVLMHLLKEYLLAEREELMRHAIRFRALGDLERLPASLRKLLQQLESDTQSFTGMVLSIAVSYGGQEEILAAARQLVTQSDAPSSVDLERFEALLPSMQVGPVDLLIRTGGEQRISNFLLWGLAYAELYFTDVYWPEFGENELFAALESYQKRQRRYGGVVADETVTHV